MWRLMCFRLLECDIHLVEAVTYLSLVPRPDASPAIEARLVARGSTDQGHERNGEAKKTGVRDGIL